MSGPCSASSWPDSATWALRGVSSRSDGEAVPEAGRLVPFAPCHQAVRAGLLLRRRGLVGRRLLRALAPQPQATASPWARRACSWPCGSAWGPSPGTATAP
ncbi:MAG: hypothetical protein MZU79_07465 [Anaerotruncus sp.]|nr:hypothetical protein [Anaerotruncus sp.]